MGRWLEWDDGHQYGWHFYVGSKLVAELTYKRIDYFERINQVFDVTPRSDDPKELAYLDCLCKPFRDQVYFRNRRLDMLCPAWTFVVRWEPGGEASFYDLRRSPYATGPMERFFFNARSWFPRRFPEWDPGHEYGWIAYYDGREIAQLDFDHFEMEHPLFRITPLTDDSALMAHVFSYSRRPDRRLRFRNQRLEISASDRNLHLSGRYGSELIWMTDRRTIPWRNDFCYRAQKWAAQNDTVLAFFSACALAIAIYSLILLWW